LFEKIEEEQEKLKLGMKDWGEEINISLPVINVEQSALRSCGHIGRTKEESFPKYVLNCSLLGVEWGRCGRKWKTY
jgi:hypothetical protein